jgi:hypothetical protein
MLVQGKVENGLNMRAVEAYRALYPCKSHVEEPEFQTADNYWLPFFESGDV